VLTHKPDPRPQWNPALYSFTPADQFDINGTYVTERTTRDGLGAPVVAVGREANQDARANFSLPRTYYGVTAIARFEGRRCVLSFEDPLAEETIQLDGHTYPLAADFTVPIAVMLARTNPKKLELARLLNPAKYAETARIARLQPYDPDKTVVLVIHGLMDSPATWTPMLNSLRGDEESGATTSSGFTVTQAATRIPTPLRFCGMNSTPSKNVSRCGSRWLSSATAWEAASARSSSPTRGQALDGAIQKPPEQVPLSPEAREIFTEGLIFRHRPEIGRVIFISAPLRGSDLASNWVGRIGSSLVKTPRTLLSAGNSIIKITTFQSGDLKLKRIPNSVDTLAPNNRFVKAINTIPITPGIPYHTIMGDRGKAMRHIPATVSCRIGVRTWMARSPS